MLQNLSHLLTHHASRYPFTKLGKFGCPELWVNEYKSFIIRHFESNFKALFTKKVLFCSEKTLIII